MNTKFLNLALGMTLSLGVALVGCSGDTRSNQSVIEPVKPVASVRTGFDQLQMLEEATGIPKATQSITDIVSERGTSLSPGGGSTLTAGFMQASLDVTAKFCIEAVSNASATRPLPQKVFPSFVKFIKPDVANFPESTVIIPLSNHLLQQFTGKKPVEQDVDIMVSSIKKFLARQISEGQNNKTGVMRAMEAACVLAAANIDSAFSQ